MDTYGLCDYVDWYMTHTQLYNKAKWHNNKYNFSMHELLDDKNNRKYWRDFET